MNQLKFYFTIFLFLIISQNSFAETTSSFFANLLMEEDCTNGIDDDGDGLIDLEDPDCFCAEQFDTLNLIKNPSFEMVGSNANCATDANGCLPIWALNEGCVDSWLNANNSPTDLQYFDRCIAQNYQFSWPPSNIFQAGDNAFMKISSRVKASNNYRTTSAYIGTSLLEPMEPGVTYKFSVQLNTLMFASDTIQLDPTSIFQTLNFSLYGHVSLDNFPYPNSNVRCPTDLFPNDYIELGNFEMITNSDRTWIELSVEFTAPTFIQRVIFGTGCRQNPVPNYSFYTFSTLVDSLSLQRLIFTEGPTPSIAEIIDTTNTCSNEITLGTSSISGATYQWYFNNQEIPNATDSIFSFENEVINDGSYFVQVVDEFGNCGISDSLAILTEAPLGITEEIKAVDCFGENSGAINLNFTDPAGLVFSWTDDQGNFISNNQNLENLTVGNYRLEINTADNCTFNYAYEITQPEELSLSTEVLNVVCEPEGLGQISINAIGGTPNYSYSTDGINFSGQSDINLPPGNYSITVLDENFCEQTIDDVVLATPEEFLLEIIPSAEIIELGETVQLRLASNRSLEDTAIQWTPQEVLDCENCTEVEATILRTTTFQVSATDDGCTVESSISVQVQKPRNVFVPNAFSPNGDGRNDEFEIFAGRGVAEILNFRVFDRWGALLFDDATQGWDGRFQNQELQNGVYVWMAEIQFLDGVVELYRGDVTLTR